MQSTSTKQTAETEAIRRFEMFLRSTPHEIQCMERITDQGRPKHPRRLQGIENSATTTLGKNDPIPLIFEDEIFILRLRTLHRRVRCKAATVSRSRRSQSPAYAAPFRRKNHALRQIHRKVSRLMARSEIRMRFAYAEFFSINSFTAAALASTENVFFFFFLSRSSDSSVTSSPIAFFDRFRKFRRMSRRGERWWLRRDQYPETRTQCGGRPHNRNLLSPA